ncbi:MAG TPA: MarR family transcriptional regulator [Paracoccaceae bacterium]|nr:MarR family transcriptional regulator [Paracoccaceae bacterium]
MVQGDDENDSGDSWYARRRAPSLSGSDIDYGLLTQTTGFPIKLVWIIGYTLLGRTIDDPAITPQRFSMLELIGSNPGLPQSRIGEALGLSRPRTSLAIDFWEARGTVERRAAPGDRRSFGIYLTPQGEEDLAHLRQRVIASDKALTSALEPDEVAELRRLLGKIHG